MLSMEKDYDLPAPAYGWRFILKDRTMITGNPRLDDYMDKIWQIVLVSNKTDTPAVTLIVRPGERPYRSTQVSFNTMTGKQYSQQILGLTQGQTTLYALVDENGNIFLSSSKDI